MSDYSRLTKSELIERLQALEQRSGNPSNTREILSNTAFESEKRLRAILETAVEGIITIDERGLIDSMNRAAEKIFGYKAEDVVGKNVSVLMPSPYREKHDGYLQNYRQTGHAKIIGIGREVIGQRKDGSTFPMDLAVSEVKLVDRRLFTGFVRDITERKEAEKVLSYHSALVASTEDAIIARTLDGSVTSWNRGAEKLLGYSAEQMLGNRFSLLLPKEEAGIDTVVRERIARGEAINSVETNFLCRSGEHVDVSVTISPIREPDGKIVGASVVARDITERKQLDAALRRQADLLYLSHDAIVVWKLDGGIESWNRGAEELYGFKENEVLGRITHEVLHTVFPEPWRKIETALRKGNWTGELRHRTRDGRELFVSARLQLVSGDDGVERVLETIRDITERKRTEEKLASLAQTLAEKNKELETIVYIASHDLRSPLVNIQGFSRELAHACDALRTKLANGLNKADQSEVKRLLNEEIPESLEYIQAGVSKIDTLLAGFLRYSRLGRAAMKMDRLDVNSMLRGIVDAMEFQIKQAGAIVRVQKLPDCTGDATLISQVFSNLLENAVKYRSPKRPCEVTVSGRVEDDQVVYVVHDNGIGIAPQHQAKIFEIFHRLNPGDTEGEGLGLTITQRIMERHGGKIWVESSPGQGSTFFISLTKARQAS